MRSRFKWVVIRVDPKYYNNIDNELKINGYSNIKSLVPTVTILKKRFKGKDIYETVPLLFNYGFLRMPCEMVYNRPLLNKLRKTITGIHSFVKSTETMHERKKKKRIDNPEDFDDFSLVSVVSRKEVHRLKRLSNSENIYTKDEIVNLTVGSYIILKGYPYEGIPATVVDINLNHKLVTVDLYPEGGNIRVSLPFSNAMYSIYSNYNEDKLLANNLRDSSEEVTEDTLSDFVNKKTF